MSALVPFAGDDRPGRLKHVSYDASTMFRHGYNTHEISLAKDMKEHAVLKRVTLERCRRLGLPNPYEADE